jgi:hypothetical protein
VIRSISKMRWREGPEMGRSYVFSLRPTFGRTNHAQQNEEFQGLLLALHMATNAFLA